MQCSEQLRSSRTGVQPGDQAQARPRTEPSWVLPQQINAFYMRRTRAKFTLLTLHGQLASGVGSCTSGPRKRSSRARPRTHAVAGLRDNSGRQPLASPASNPEACLRAKDWSLPSRIGTEGPIDGTGECQAWGLTPNLSASQPNAFKRNVPPLNLCGGECVVAKMKRHRKRARADACGTRFRGPRRA